MTDRIEGRITVLEGLEAVRRRPAKFIGIENQHQLWRAKLLELTVADIAWEWGPQEVRILLWREDAVTIAHDGRPLPIEPWADSVGGIPHPALYRSFMTLRTGAAPPGGNGLAILNALSEQLVVSTLHDSLRYRSVFCKGMIVSLLSPKRYPGSPLGTTWLTYRPDATIVPGQALTPDGAHGIVDRVGMNLHRLAERLGPSVEGVKIRVEDRMTEDADWD